MKHKLTVLACIGLALLVLPGFAFAQNTITVNGGPLDRCKSGQMVTIEVDNTADLGAIGLPLTISGGATIDAATPNNGLGAPLEGFTTAVGGFPGTAGVVNAVGSCLEAGLNQVIWTLSITTPDDCSGTIEIDTAFFPPAGGFVVTDCVCCPVDADFNKGVFTLVDKNPICADPPDEPNVHWVGAPFVKAITATDPDVCDVASLTYQFLDAAPPLAGGVVAAGLGPAGTLTYERRCADKGPHVVRFTVTDQCGKKDTCRFTLTVTNDVPLCGVTPNISRHFAAGVVNYQLAGSDPSDPVVWSLVSVVPAPAVPGSATVSSDGKFNWATTCADARVGGCDSVHTVTYRVSDTCDAISTCTFTVTVTQNAPICSDAADITDIDWLAPTASIALSATDDGCRDPYTWSVVSVTPPHAVGVVPAVPVLTGSSLTFDPDCADVGTTFVIKYSISDGCKADTCEVSVTVTNDKPTAICPNDIFAILGDLIVTDANGTDPDNNPLTFALISFDHLEDPGRVPHNDPVVTFNTANGNFSWQTESYDNQDEGLWEACVEVSDGCGLKDTCCFQIDVLAFCLSIGPEVPPGPVANSFVNTCCVDTIIHTLSGMIATAYVRISDNYPLGGLDLLLCYDQSGLSFLDAQALDGLAGWEYFTWRYSARSNCGAGCPTGLIRIVAIADLDNGPTHHPADADFYLDGQIVALRFFVSADRNFIGQCFRVGFCTIDCGDNALSSKSGDTLFIPIGADQSCIDPTKQVARDIIHFCDGRICVEPPPDDRGDINLNFIANEVGDAVLFTNYFIYGSSVWTSPYELGQILATDINDDGVVLTVADLIYLIRIITGDASPFPAAPKLSPYANSASATYRIENGNLIVSTTSPVDLGGALFVFRYSGMTVGSPTLSTAAADLKVNSRASNGELRVLVHPDFTTLARVNAGTHDIVSIPTTGDGSLELAEVQLSDSRGALLYTTAAGIRPPSEYALMQNYPNPFNAGTVMRFDLKEESDWSLNVYNIAGQTVRTFAGHSTASQVQVAWDGTDESGNAVASGMYFYRVNAKDFSATRKMTLMK